MAEKKTALKCVLCLLIISVVSGALISALSQLLFVSANERTMRAIRKIYGAEVEYSVILDTDSEDENTDKNPVVYEGTGRIDKIYRVGDSLLFMSTGFNGYKNGTVTLWVKVTAAENGNNTVYSVDKVMLQSFDKQTLMSKLDERYYSAFQLEDVTSAYYNGELFTAKDKDALNYNPVSGATMSATAGVNAVNCILKYLGELV